MCVEDLLSLFPAHRRLEAQRDQLRDKTVSQQDEIRHLKRQLDQATEDRNEAVERAAKAWEQTANWLAKRSGLGTISMASEQVPEAPRPDMTPIPQTKPLGRDVVNENWAFFEKEMAESYNEWQKDHLTDGSGNPDAPTTA